MNFFLLLAVLGIFLAITIYRFESGILFFIFSIPLYHIVAIFLGQSRFLTILFMFLGIFIGAIINMARKRQMLIDWEWEISKPILVFTIIMTLSYIFVVLRIYDILSFYPHLFRDYILNVDLKTTGDALNLANYQYLNYFTSFMLLFIALRLDITRKFLSRLFYTLFASASIVFIGAIYQFFIDPYFMGQATGIGEQGWIAENTFANRFGSTLIDPNSLGIYSIIMLLVFIGFLLYCKKKHKKILASIGIFMTVILLLFSGSRTGFFAVALLILYYIFHWISIGIRKAFIKSKVGIISNRKVMALTSAFFIIVIVLAAAAIILLFLKLDETLLPVTLKRVQIDIQNLFSGDYRTAVNDLLGGRRQLWQAAFFAIREHPVDGVGIGMITIELPNYGDFFGILGLPRDMADNYYIQVTAEMGIFALGINLWIFWIVLKSYGTYISKILSTRLKDFAFHLYMIVPLMLAMFLFGPHTYFMEVSLLFYFIIGIFLNLRSRSIVDEEIHIEEIKENI